MSLYKLIAFVLCTITELSHCLFTLSSGQLSCKALYNIVQARPDVVYVDLCVHVHTVNTGGNFKESPCSFICMQQYLFMEFHNMKTALSGHIQCMYM